MLNVNVRSASADLPYFVALILTFFSAVALEPNETSPLLSPLPFHVPETVPFEALKERPSEARFADVR